MASLLPNRTLAQQHKWATNYGTTSNAEPWQRVLPTADGGILAGPQDRMAHFDWWGKVQVLLLM